MAPGPYNAPHQAPPPMQPMQPMPMYGPSVQTDSKATISLVLGILSIFCCGMGMLFGIPALVLGVMSKRDIDRSGGALGGDGMAIGGAVLGALSTLLSLVYVVMQIVAFTSLGSATTPTGAIPYTPPPVYTTPLATGAIHATELKPGGDSLETQLLGEIAAAKASGEQVLVYEYAKGAVACTEFDRALTDYEMQRVLAKVRLVRVEASSFGPELAALGMNKAAYPWFYKVEARPLSGGKEALSIADSISGDEWSDNYAYNIAPVLEQFLNGTLVKTAPTASASGAPSSAAPKPIPTHPPLKPRPPSSGGGI